MPYKISFSKISSPTSLGNWWNWGVVFKKTDTSPVAFFMEDAGRVNDPRAVPTAYPLKIFESVDGNRYEETTQKVFPTAPKMNFLLGFKSHIDVNRDGLYDIIPFDETEYPSPGPNFNGARQFMLMSQSDGTYREITLISQPVTTHALSAADLDRDGSTEILFTNIGGNNPNSFLLSVTPGGTVSNYKISEDIIRKDTHNQNNPRDIYFYSGISDLNNDGAQDLVFFSPSNPAAYWNLPDISNRSVIYWNDGRGTFSTERKTHIPVEKYLYSGKTKYYMVVQNVSFEDFNKDGSADMLLSYMAMPTGKDEFTSTYPAQAYGILINDGKGNFVDRTKDWFGTDEFHFTDISMTYGKNDSRIQVGDFNNSGLPSFFARTYYFDSANNMHAKCVAFINTGRNFHQVLIDEFDPFYYKRFTGEWPELNLTITSPMVVDPYAKKLTLYSMNNFLPHPDKGVIYRTVVDDLPTRFNVNGDSIATDVNGSAGKAYRVYKAAFNRDPETGDKSGLGYWIAQIDKGMDLIEVSARFVDSNEFRTLYGTNPTNEQFLTKLYTNVLGRQPEASGYNWWLNELNTNPAKTKAKVLADFAESPENQTGVLGLIGNGITYEPWVG